MHARQTFMLALLLLLPVTAVAETLTLPADQRPAWLSRDGIVMAASHEPLLFRARRDGGKDYTPSPEQLEAYRREHSPEMVARLRALGVNFVMMHCYKGAGFKAEAESMQDAVKFAKLCHEAGMRVGVYNFSCAFLWELLFQEVPEAKDWLVLDAKGNPLPYGRTTFRYFWNRNHPGAQAYYKQAIRFAIEEVHTDLVHLDNYAGSGPAYDDYSVKLFRRYLRDNFSAQQRKAMEVGDLDSVRPPVSGFCETLLGRAWQDFRCQAAADSYHDMTRYARSLRKDILMELNPHGIRPRIRPPTDHSRLLTGGEAFWDEGIRSGMRNGRVQSIIPTYKVARKMNNIVFRVSSNPLELAEAMAFNQDSLGCVCSFEYGDIRPRSLAGDQPAGISNRSFIRFFHARRDLLRDTKVVADVAVLRSFPSQVFAPPEHASLTQNVEQALIEKRVCFQIIYDQHLAELDQYKALVLAGCVALSDEQAAQIARYVNRGGQLCIIGPVGTHDNWMLPRKQATLADLPTDRIVQIATSEDWLAAIRRACDDRLSLTVSGPVGLCTELTSQQGRRLVHLVNFRPDGPIKNVSVSLHLPEGCKASSVRLASPAHDEDVEVNFQQRDDNVVYFTIPKVGIYEIAVLELVQ